MASLIYNSFLGDLLRGRISIEGGLFKVMLVTSAYQPNNTSDTRRSDVRDEISGQGYVTGGALVDVERSEDVSRGVFDIILGQVEWRDATLTAAGAIYYRFHNGRASSDELVAFIDFGHDVTATNGTFSLTPSQLRIRN